jgi:hypothetical protein
MEIEQKGGSDPELNLEFQMAFVQLVAILLNELF